MMNDGIPIDLSSPSPCRTIMDSPNANDNSNFVLKKKVFYPVSPRLFDYLNHYQRIINLPPIYEELHRFSELYPLFDSEGRDTLWKVAAYEPGIRFDLSRKLIQIYSILKTNELRYPEHLSLGRVDFCEFGNSRPFRIRIVNQFNDNYDHFYVKVADASRIYGLELEYLLSPNRINYLIHDNTLIEEHIAGVPGDVFIQQYFDRLETNQVRVAKEFVKFNERSFIRLLGDMRSYNYVVDITPDFEDAQYRVRAIDFDQQSYSGNLDMYLPQTFEENQAVVELCTKRLNYLTMKQYQDEERALIERRCHIAHYRLGDLWGIMCTEALSPESHVVQLREQLGCYHETNAFSRCETMGEIVRENLNVSLAKPKN